MITSTQNPRIIEARKLTQRKHRLRQNRFLVEGLQLLGMATQAMLTTAGRERIIPRQIFYSEALFTSEIAPRLLAQLSAAGAEAIPIAPQVMDTLSERDTSQGLIATFALRELELPLEYLLSRISSSPNLPISQAFSGTPQSPISPSPPLILILDRLQDPGNLGTLIRTADAVGARAVILIEPCVDPFDPKTVRSTMGSIFTVPFIRVKHAGECLPHLAKMGYRLVGADARRGQTAWRGATLTGATALALGNEARGLSAELHDFLTDYVSLPLYGQAESLNVAIAGGVLMYEWLRVNGW
jgi:TrmH family RNA methyltransferase